MGDVIEFVDLLVFFKVIDMIQWTGTLKFYVISLSVFWGVLWTARKTGKMFTHPLIRE